MPHSVSGRPWSKLGVNIFKLQGQQYLVIVDYYSGFIEVDPLTHLTVKYVINHCKSQFSRHGIPDTLISDNGPQFSSHEFQQFVNSIRLTTTLPAHTTHSPMVWPKKLYRQSKGYEEDKTRC